MARKSRGDGNVMDQLADIAEKVIHETGFFFCGKYSTVIHIILEN